MLTSICQVGHEQFEQASAGGVPGGPGSPFGGGGGNPFEDIFGSGEVCTSSSLEYLMCCFSHHLSSFVT